MQWIGWIMLSGILSWCSWILTVSRAWRPWGLDCVLSPGRALGNSMSVHSNWERTTTISSQVNTDVFWCVFFIVSSRPWWMMQVTAFLQSASVSGCVDPGFVKNSSLGNLTIELVGVWVSYMPSPSVLFLSCICARIFHPWSRKVICDLISSCEFEHSSFHCSFSYNEFLFICFRRPCLTPI